MRPRHCSVWTVGAVKYRRGVKGAIGCAVESKEGEEDRLPGGG